METKVEGPHVRWHHEVKNLADLPKKSHRMKIYSLFLYQISNGTHIDALDSVHLINWWQLRLARKLGHCCLSMILVFLDNYIDKMGTPLPNLRARERLLLSSPFSMTGHCTFWRWPSYPDYSAKRVHLLLHAVVGLKVWVVIFWVDIKPGNSAEFQRLLHKSGWYVMSN